MNSRIKSIAVKSMLVCWAALGVIAASGCQSNYAGQTLPSAYFLKDDIQYFAKGPQHKLHREAAALQAARAEEMTRR